MPETIAIDRAFKEAFSPKHVMAHDEFGGWVDGRLDRLRRVTRLEQRYVNFRPAKPAPPPLPERVRERRTPPTNEKPPTLLYTVIPTLIDTRLVPVLPSRRRDHDGERGYVHPGPQPQRLKRAKPTATVEPPDAAAIQGCVELAHRTITSPEGVRFAAAHGFKVAA